MRKTALACTFFLAMGAVACGGSDDPGDSGPGGGGNGGPGATSGNGAGATGGPGSGGGSSDSTGAGGTPGNWQVLIQADWQLPSGGENTSDTHIIVLDQDMFVGAIRPIAPQGTHHTLLGINGVGASDNVFASGVGTNELVFPPGVGLRLPAGETIVLQLHIFNPTADVLTGTSGIEVIPIAAADVQHEAEIFLPGPLGISIPPNSDKTITGTCPIGSPQTIFALFPHMHQLGKHLKTTLTIDGQAQVLHDEDYQFAHQPVISFEPIQLSPGDSVTTACTYKNTTSSNVGWGESSNSEMCFSILYRYPKSGGDFCGG
ncbi:MAG: hypothetical protein WKG00_22190 [Polyangiaceae bacterium]